MANRIVQAIYDLKDNVTAGLQRITNAFNENKKASDSSSAAIAKNSREMSEQIKGTAEAVEFLKGTLEAIGIGLGLQGVKEGLEAILETGQKFHDLGEQFNTVFGGVEQGTKTLQDVKDIAEGVPQSFETVAAAALKLKQAGFDPLDGTLQALLDNSAALKQSDEQLMATIEALSAANIRGAIPIKALSSLVQSGIPVFDLLAKGLGVTADRVRQMAKEGQLSSDVIKTLVVQLGELRKGAAAAELGDFDAQLTKLKDSGREFLNVIAQSGVLQTFEEELKNLNAQVRAAAADGSLQSLGKNIADGIIGATNAIKTGIQFVIDYSGELVTLGKVALTIKAINLATTFIETQAALEKVAATAKKTTAEAAASATVFGKLKNAVSSIPSQVKIAMTAIGIDIILSELGAIKGAIDEQRAANQEADDIEKDRVEVLTNLAQRVAAVKAQYQQFADVAIQSQEQLNTQNAEALQGYQDQLNGAQKFYQALVVQARIANDAAGLADAKAKLGLVNAELKLVNDQLILTKATGDAAGTGLSAAAVKIGAQLAQVATDAKGAQTTITKIFEGFDLRTQITEVGDFAAGFDSVADKGGKAGDVLNATLVETLKKLSGEDLLRFQSAATAALDGLGEDAIKNSATLKNTLEVALERLGTKVGVADQAITKSGQNMIATFQAVAENAQASSATVADAFVHAIGSAQTISELDELGKAFEAAFNTGKVDAQDFGATIIELDEKVRTLTATLNPLQSQFDILGIKSQAQLNAIRDNAKEAFQAIVDGAHAGTQAQEDVQRAFDAMAKATLDSVKDSEQWKQDTVKDQLEVIASANGLSDAVLNTGKSGKKAGEDTATAFDKAKDSIDGTGKAAEDASDKFNRESQAWGDALATQATQAASAAQGITLLTNEQIVGLRAIRQELQAGALSSAQYAAKISDLMEGTNIEIQKELDSVRRFNDEVSNLKLQLIQAQGGDAEQEEEIRHQQALENLKDEATVDGELDTAKFAKLRDLEDQIHEQNLDNIKKEAQAKIDAQKQVNDTNTENTPPAPTPNTPVASVDINVNITQTGVAPGASQVGLDDATLSAIVSKITPILLNQLSRQRTLGGG